MPRRGECNKDELCHLMGLAAQSAALTFLGKCSTEIGAAV